jgi:capsular exopolysaccharide synthesis family protein
MLYRRQWLSPEVIQTEAELITSTMLIRRVIKRLALDKDPEFNAELRNKGGEALSWLSPSNWLKGSGDGDSDVTPGAQEEMRQARIVKAVLSRLTVVSQRRSFVIEIRFVSTDREKAAQIANVVAETYMNDRLEASLEEARRVTAWLGDRLENMRNDVAAAENAVESYRAANNLRRSDQRQATLSDQQLSELNSRLVIARAELSQKEARLAQVRALARSPESLATASDVLQSSLIQRLREQEAAKSREVSEAEKTYGDRHPRIVGLRADLEDLRAKITEEINKIAASLSSDVQIALAGVRSMEAELAGVRRETTTAGAAEVRLRELERQAEASKSLYEAMLGRFKRDTEMEQMRRANARIVSPAEVPTAPSAPRTLSIMVVVTLLSLILGVGLVFLIDRLDSTLRSADEVEEITGLPALALIPMQKEKGDRTARQLLEKPTSGLADSLRNLRTAVEFGVPPGGSLISLVTSSVPREGKTFVSLCLGITSARSGSGRVLMIDADLHRPRLNIALDLPGERGLGDILDGTATFDEVVQHNVVDGVDLLAAGQTQSVVDLIHAQSIQTLLTELQGRYSRIIIDSPPVLAVSDTRMLARMAHRVIYLVQWGTTPRDAVRNGIKVLRMAGAPPHGVVLSQVNQNKHAGYGYGDYGQYYGRYRDYYGSR